MEGGTTMGRQFQFQFQDFFSLSKFCSLRLFLHSLLHMFVLLSLILTNSPSPFASISFFYYLFLSLSHLIQLLLSPIILAACSSKSDFYTRNWFPISISVLCKKIPSLSFALHSLLGRRNLIAWGLYIPHL
jgi:hypothetical protein